MEFNLNLSPRDAGEREAFIRAGLLNADGTPRPVRVDMSQNAGGVFDDGGKRLLAPISPSDVHESAEIPTYLSGYRNGEYRADEAATIQPVDYRNDKYRKEALANTFQRRNTEVAFDGAVPEIDVSTSLDEYTVKDYAQAAFVSTTTERNEGASRFRARAASAKLCANAIMLDREYRVWADLVTSGNWNAANVQTLNASTKWNGGASSDPVQNLRDMMSTSLSKITAIWMNELVAGVLLKNAEFREHMRQMLGDGVPAPNVAQMMTQLDRGEGSYDFVVPGFPPFKVVTGKYTSTSAETASVSRLLGNHVVGLRTLPKAPVSGEDVATYTTFRWKGTSGTGWESREFDVPGRGMQGGRMIVVCMSEVNKFTSSRVGGLILNAHA